MHSPPRILRLAATFSIATTASLAAQQLYECTTTTRTTTYYSHDEFGNYYQISVSVTSRICAPI
jgi:hypothetical protein